MLDLEIDLELVGDPRDVAGGGERVQRLEEQKEIDLCALRAV
jgi:hypothetical protein